MRKLFLMTLFFLPLFSNQTYYEYGKIVELTPLEAKKTPPFLQTGEDENDSITYYKNNRSQIVGVGNTIIAKCINPDACARVMEKYTDLAFKPISKNVYLIYLEKHEEIFDISVKLYEEGCFEYVHPNFYKEKRLR